MHSRRLTLFLSFLLFALPVLAGNDVANVRYVPGYSYAGPPAIAANGNRFLTLWNAQTFWNGYRYIYGTQSDASGGSNSPAFPVVPYANTYSVAVIGTGSGYAAIWNDPYDGRPSFGRLTSEGVLARRVALAMPRFTNPVLASNGSRIAIVDPYGGIGISITDLDGNLLRSSLLTRDQADSYAVVAVGSDFIVMTADSTGIIQWRVTNDGIGQAVALILPPSAYQYSYAIAAAAKNGRIVTAWTEPHRPSGTLAWATIQPDGTVTQKSLPDIGAAPFSSPVVLPVDRGFVIAWSVTPPAPATPHVFALRLDDNGTPLDDHASFLTDGQFTGAASSGNTIKFVFSTSSTTTAGVATVAATVDAYSIAVQPAAAVLSPVSQTSPVVTGNGAGFTASWLERDSGGFRVVAGRMNPAGEPRDGTGIVLDFHASYTPVIAHGRSEDLIVWTSSGRLKATRLSVSGDLLDATPIDIASADYGPHYDVVWNGSRFFVVWIGDYGGFYYAFVGPDGVATPAKAFFFSSEPYRYPGTINIAWDGRQYIVVYKEFAPEIADATTTVADIRVMRLSADGIVRDPVPARIDFGDSSADGLVHVASSGSESLLVFDRDSGPVAVVLRDQGTRLHLDPEIPLLHWERGMSGVTWNGSAYVVATRYALNPFYMPDQPGWLSAIEISQSGIPLRTTTAPAAGPFDWYAPPSIATDLAAGTAFVTAEVTPQTGVPRARIYLSSELSPATVPTPPPAPRNAVCYISGTTAHIDWQSDGGADGFLIDYSSDGKTWWRWRTLGADARTFTFYVTEVGAGVLLRVRAFGAGGLSEGSITSLQGMSGRRPGRR